MISFQAEVLDIRQESRERWQVLLDTTAFTGALRMGTLEAVARSGVRILVPVLGVVIEGSGETWHVISKPLAAGTAVVGRIADQGAATV